MHLSDVTLEAWVRAVKDAHGAMQGTIGIALDITERVRLEEQFRRLRKWKRSADWPGASRTTSTIC